MPKALLAWSGGKDSAMALSEVRSKGTLEISGLLTTVTRDFDRVSMHGVRRTLLEQQADSLGLQLEKVWIRKGANNREYESQMRLALERHRSEGVGRVVFGDIFLEDVRRYREESLAEVGMQGVFPLWGRDTRRLAEAFVDSGFRAILCCVDPRKLGRSYCGVEFDRDLLASLPGEVDPCGENGEFHTFVYDGPIFKKRIDAEVGKVVMRDGFYFADILPVAGVSDHQQERGAKGVA